MNVWDIAVKVWKLVARYPAVSAGLTNVAIVLGSYLGLDLTATQLTTVATAVAAVFGVLVTIGVIPVTNVDGVKAGLKAMPGEIVYVPPESVPTQPYAGVSTLPAEGSTGLAEGT